MPPIFRRRKRAWVGRYEDPEVRTPPSIDSLVDEGVLIAASGIRMTVKNLAILSILRDGGSYALDWYLERVREQLRGFAGEKADDAARVDRELAASENPVEIGAADRPGEDELNRLIRRTEMLRGLTARLSDLGSDEDYVTALALASRDAAWDDISASIKATALRRATDPEPLSRKDRVTALADLRTELDSMSGPPGPH